MGIFCKLIDGKVFQFGQWVVYVDGGFDLFLSGYIVFLCKVVEVEEDLVCVDGWFIEQVVNECLGKGVDYLLVYIVVGVYEDEVIN